MGYRQRVAARLVLCLAGSAILGAAAKDVRFEVLSLRPVNGPMGGAMTASPSPNGFDARLSLWQMIQVAYGPADPVNWGSVEILKTPGWAGEFYDIKGRVSQADLKAWQSQGKEHELLRSAMRIALKERCKLAIHEEPGKGEIFELLIGKRGPRLKEAAAPSPTLPAGIKLPSGGVLVQTVQNGQQVKTYHAASMQDLAAFLSIMSGRTPVRDRTGLTGRYDFTIRQTPPQPDENHVYSYSVSHLGLQVKAGVETRPRFVVDHIERPTPN